MKKINFYLGALAVASTALLSSCFSSDGDDTPEVPSVDIVENVVLCEINKTANVDDVTYEGPSSATKGQTITIKAKANTPGKYTTDEIEKTITVGDQESIDVDFVFTVKPAAVDVADAVEGQESVTVFQGENSTTTTESEAAQVEIVEGATVNKVAMEIPASSVEAAQSQVQTTAFSVVVVPANDTIKQVPVTEIENVEAETKKDSAEVATLQAICEPSGVTFSEPVTITISAPESAGLAFYAQNGESTVEGNATANTLSVAVPHFSAWDFVLRAKVENVAEKQTYETKTAIVAAGDNNIKYTSKLGWKVDKQNVLVKAYLVGKLGSSKEINVNKTANFKSTGDGKVTYRVISKTIEFDVVSGTARFHVTANAGSSLEIVNVEYNGHSGGSAN